MGNWTGILRWAYKRVRPVLGFYIRANEALD
jgi:hypothetical protein